MFPAYFLQPAGDLFRLVVEGKQELNRREARLGGGGETLGERTR